ncbi:hypothetical protein CCHL11_04390 [Colletotrichum chlorophyti]|uniref:Uncharacterized protein n=1 Tax=Colletotrichum chlorophyti TaxID=708187 RepID=A0A1Q8RMB1_9PEZI|nr:hypothetical protein CCHL11_04390 [Colletotrichum chlorophyti]
MAEVIYQSLNSTLASHFKPFNEKMASHIRHDDGLPSVHEESDILGGDISMDSDLSSTGFSSSTMVDRSRPRHLPHLGEDHPIDKSFLSPRASSPTGSTRSTYTTRRRISRGAAWSAGRLHFQHSYRSEVSKELTAQAESEFFALTELMASMSRRSLSLKEVWSKIIAERESCYAEMDIMAQRFEEFTETIEREKKERGHHHHEHEERKKEIEKIRLELTAAFNSSSEFKLKLAERDAECRTLRHELSELKESLSYSKKEHEETKKTSEQTRLTLIATEAARNDLEGKCGKLRGERDSLDLKYTELHSRYEELSSKFESSHKELVQIRQINTMLKKEKHDWLHLDNERDEKMRKCEHRHEELRRKYKELEERYEKRKLEVKELHETITRVKHEKEELSQHVEKLKHDLEDEHRRWEEAEARCSKWKLKWEHSEREVISIRDEISRIEISQTELREVITKKTEEVRLLIIEKKRLREELDHATGRVDENHRQLLLVQESLNHTETTLKKTEEEVHIKTERLQRLEFDLHEMRGKIATFESERSSHQSLVASLKLEVSNLNTHCGTLKEKCHDWESKYEEVCESVTEYEEGSSSWDYEISNLRTMLEEAREQKEKAISSRNSADRERDEAISRYEEKCRQMERLEQRLSMQLHMSEHSHGHRSMSGGRTITRYSKGSHTVTSGEHSGHFDSTDS